MAEKKRWQINVRSSEEGLAALAHLTAILNEQLGVRVSQADAVALAVREALERRDRSPAPGRSLRGRRRKT